MNFLKNIRTQKNGFIMMGLFVAIIDLSLLTPSLAFAAGSSVPLGNAQISIKAGEAHLLIPRIGLDAIIKDEGLTPGGAMAVPDNNIEVGWFGIGTRPGEIGSAVIGGHNRWDNNAGVFGRLNELRKGDVLTVVDALGFSISFTVSGMRLYNPTDSGKTIFDSLTGSHLNLITCSGIWDKKTKGYSKRLVIFADLNLVPSV